MNDFDIKNKSEAKKFETQLINRLSEDVRFLSSKGDVGAITERSPQANMQVYEFTANIVHLPTLDELYDISGKDTKLFSLLFDLKINVALIMSDFHQMLRANNNLIAYKNKKDNCDEQIIFNYKYDIHRYMNSFILRFRAYIDKIMGAYIYCFYDSPKYENFLKSRSRKNYFLKLENGGKLDKTFFDLIKELNTFDNKFRTPEAHGSGRLRKFSFSEYHFFHTEAGELKNWFNKMLDLNKVLSTDLVDYNS